MKNLLILMSTVIMLNTACTDSELSKRDAKVKLLTQAPWFAESVKHETNGDLIAQYETMAFSFTKNSSVGYAGEYFVVNGGIAFPDAVGKWKFNEELNTLVLNNGQEIDVILTDNSLELTVTVAPASGGRASGVSGRFTFLMRH